MPAWPDEVAAPRRLVRRLVLAPTMILATALVLSVTPIVLLALAFVVRFLPGRLRGLRLFWFLCVYLLRESLGLFALATLWVISGFGRRLDTERFRRAHVRLAGWFLRGLVGSASTTLGLAVVSESVPDDLVLADASDPASVPERPVLVFSRHAGAGDSLLLVDLLINTYGRRPRIVLKDLMQLDPCIDVVLNRLPSRFIPSADRRVGSVVDSITELAADLEPDGALILFPEGGNFTEHRRARAIQRFEASGLEDAAHRARELTCVLPPRPGGAFAAIDACPAADVLFVAHTGLEQLSGLRDLWKGLPMDRDVRLTYWTVPNDDIPSGEAERLVWLFDWWETIDTWIEDHHDPDLSGSPVVVADTQGTG